MNAESEGRKMSRQVACGNKEFEKFTFFISKHGSKLFSPDPITDDPQCFTAFKVLYMAVKSSLTENSYAVLL